MYMYVYVCVCVCVCLVKSHHLGNETNTDKTDGYMHLITYTPQSCMVTILVTCNLVIHKGLVPVFINYV